MGKLNKSDENELVIVRRELAFQKEEKDKLTGLLIIARKELAFQKEEKGKRAAELGIANKERVFQDEEKGKRADELFIANKELVFQDEEKVKRADELIIANNELVFQNEEKDKRAAELIIANKELVFQNEEKEKRAAELFIANQELVFQTGEKEKRAAELVIADIELVFQNKEKEKREIANKELEEAKSKAESATRIAEDAVKAKQQFLSNMSHEIRTPMNAIIGFTKVVLKTDLSAKQKEYLTAIKMSGDALIVLINDILDLAKVDAGKMTFEQTPFKMAVSISAMLHLFETKIKEKNVQLIKQYDKNIPEVLVGDPVRLHQIILNLVSNAVKFTVTGEITVNVCLLDEDDEKVNIEFSVTDTGIGIPENKLENIFENFEQASSGTARLYGGTGLGLAIVKQLVKAQGGNIRVKSRIDEGSTFSFILSFQKTKAAAELETGIEEMDTEIKNIKVLVVEDMALNQLLMKTLLDDFGFERDIATNGKIAIEKLENKTYDIILMDLQMPEMNGFEATEYIRNKMNSRIPIIALTADVTTVDLAKCKAAGMNDYIAKPVDERLLYNKIVGLVKKPVIIKYKEREDNGNGQSKKAKCIDLNYLIRRTKSDPTLMMEMISLYLEQTPPLIAAMKQSLRDRDWTLLQAAVHKIIPSFSIMGINPDFENMAKQVKEYAITQQQTDEILYLVLQLENICEQACVELEEEFNTIKNAG
jgi:signal transduction histidine kinase/DNA-binding response OmpR family regulator